MASKSDIHVRVLGPIDVVRADEELAVGPQLRRMLGFLMVAEGQEVRADAIAEHLADGDVDGSKIRTAVSRLRKLVGDRIETVPNGYRLRLDESESDVGRLEMLRAEFDRAPAADRIDIGRQALDLWRGPTLGDVAEESWAEAWAGRLDEARASLTEDLADAMLATERPQAAIELLDQHVLAHPFRERPVELLMRAQAANGQRADALRSFQRLRITLRDELGLDPSPELRALESRLLSPDEGQTASMASSGPTLSVLFTDIEGSTHMWRRDQHAMSQDLAEHDRTLEHAISSEGGRVFKHTGDGMAAVFTSATAAVRAARTAQAALRLPVRMGIHTGEVIERDGDCYGPTVNLCARIADAGHGGQLLLSAAVVAIVGDAEVIDLGEHTLKGIAGPQRVYQWGHEGFAPLRVAHQSSNLPRVLHALVGRDQVVTTVEQELDTSRLVTLLGPGGIGKTTLALTVAERMAETVDLALFLGLDEVNDSAEVLPALAQALRLSTSRRESVVAALSGRRVLLVIDNCEHVLDAVADLVDDLLQEVPMCRILATSREGLGVAGERVVVVPGLDTSTVESAAVELIVDRVRALDPSVAFDGADREALQEICRKVDGLPLAIELAAARIPMLGVDGVLGRLDARFDMLTGAGRRRSSDRQRTLRATVDWSHDLLDDHERAAFARLSVFAASFDLDGAVAMLGNRPEMEVLDLLTALVQKSLISIESVDGVRRYRYLETMRSYAFERLEARRDVADAMESLHRHLVGAMQSHLDEIRLGSLTTGAERLRREMPNVRVSFEHALDQGNLNDAAELIAPIPEVFGAIPWPVEGWADEILSLPGSDDVRFHRHLLALKAHDLFRSGDYSGFRVVVAQFIGDDGPDQVPADLRQIALGVLMLADRQDEWLDAIIEAHDVTDRHDPRTVWLRLVAFCHKLFAGEGAELLDDWRAAIASVQDGDSELLRAEGHWGSALIADAGGDHDAMLRESRALLDLRVLGSTDWIMARGLVALAEYEMGNISAALTSTNEMWDVAQRYVERPQMYNCLALHALILDALGESETAAIVSARLLPRGPVHLFARPAADLERRLQSQLGAERCLELRQRARDKKAEELLSLAHEAEARHFDSVAPHN